MTYRDFMRFLAVLTSGAIIGWLSGQMALCLLLASVGYSIWLHRKLGQVLHWLRDRRRNDMPDVVGVFEQLCLEIEYLRERHKKRKKKLSSYLKQFQQATRALPDATLLLDNDGAVQWANDAAKTYLGIRWPEDANRRLTNLLRIPELRDFLAHRQQIETIEIVSPIDSAIFLSLRIGLFGKNQWLLVARDVTQLHRANEIRRDFVANVSHELRTPITVIRGYLENLSAQSEVCPPAWKPALEQMSDHANRMQALVEELLLLSRLEQSDRANDLQVLSVADLLTDIVQQAKSIKAAKEHQFILDLDSTLLIEGSATELYSAFSNLIFNAIHYTSGNGVIRIRWYLDAEGAHLEISDNGIGIGAEHLERITERFYRVDNSRARASGGTGLGLSITKHVLARHDAALVIDSTLGAGSTFRCDFPLTAISGNADTSRTVAS